MSRFGRAWAVASGIDGWLTERDARLLFNAATACDPMIVEIGAYCGRSTELLASAGVPMTTVDPLVPGKYPSESMHISKSCADRLQEVVDRHDNLNWVRRESEQHIPAETVGLLYIDGKHSDDQPWRDYKHYRPCLTKWSLVAFHDYKTRSEVVDAVTMAEQRGELQPLSVGDSLYLGQFNG